MMSNWYVVVFRDNGTVTSLHPNYRGGKFGCKAGQAHHLGPGPASSQEIPRSGLGGSSGPGTYKHFKFKHSDVELKFDPRKAPA